MFTHRIRKAALVLAGAAILATSLTTTIALAAPESPAVPAVSERIEHFENKITLPPKLPRADLVVTSLGFTADATIQNVEYRFRITNNGPDKMTFKYDGKALWAYDGNPNGYQYGPSGHATRSSGESIDLVVPCHLSGDPSHYCASGELTVEPVFGVDTDPGNNHLSIKSGNINAQP